MFSGHQTLMERKVSACFLIPVALSNVFVYTYMNNNEQLTI